jgi:hypothetical protein
VRNYFHTDNFKYEIYNEQNKKLIIDKVIIYAIIIVYIIISSNMHWGIDVFLLLILDAMNVKKKTIFTNVIAINMKKEGEKNNVKC